MAPRSQGEIAEEILAAREACALADLSTYCRLEFTGADRIDFLHRLLTSHVKRLRPGDGQPSLLLDSKGRIQAELQLLAMEDRILGISWPPLGPRVLEILERYRFSEKVQFRDGSTSWSLMGVLGPDSESLLELLIKGPDRPFHSCRCRGLGLEGYLLLVPGRQSSEAAKRIREEGKVFGMRSIGLEALEVLRIEQGLPRFDRELEEGVYPAEARLDEACALDKGCFIGQEVVARMATYGSPPKTLVGLSFSDSRPVEKDARLRREGIEVGKVTSWVFSPRLGRAIGLGYVQRGEAGYAGPLTTSTGLEARISLLPF